MSPMNLLFHDRLAPVTSTIGFIETDLPTAVRSFVRWQEPIQSPRGVVLATRSLEGGLESAIMALPPLTSVEARRFLFVATASSWVAYFDNGYRGTDATGPMAYLARTMGCRAMRVVAIPHHEPKRANGHWRGRYGATILDLFGPEVKNHANTIRSITMMNDGGKWTFHEMGDRLAFEDPETYKAKRIRDRFPVELLAHYLKQLGLEPFAESFYRSPAVLVEKHGPCAADMKEYSLDEVRAGL
jgi:hypothetical protein